MKRKKLKQSHAKKLFTATSGVKPLNTRPTPMRGGFRL